MQFYFVNPLFSYSQNKFLINYYNFKQSDKLDTSYSDLTSKSKMTNKIKMNFIYDTVVK